MGYADDRAYWATRAGLPVDVPGLTLQQLIDLASSDKPDASVSSLMNFVLTNALQSGEENIPRDLAQAVTVPCVSGAINLSYFTARKSESVSQMRVVTGGTAAGATPTTVKFGVYSVDPSTGDLTRVAITANDTALLAAANTAYAKAFTAPFTKVQGQRYALATLVVTGAATPTFVGSLANAIETLAQSAPLLQARLTAQTDLIASITAASLSMAAARFYGVVLP